jgi:hypothetical protein
LICSKSDILFCLKTSNPSPDTAITQGASILPVPSF